MLGPSTQYDPAGKDSWTIGTNGMNSLKDGANETGFHSNETGSTMSSHATITYYIAGICLVWYCVVLLVSMIGVVSIKIKNMKFKPFFSGDRTNLEENFRRTDPYTGPEGVTILRPLKGLDTEMDVCLSSTFIQQYSPFEIIFCVANPVDPAIAVVEKLIKEHPDVDARVIVGEANFGPNPKINNLVKGYAEAKYDIIWVLDSNVWITSGALSRSVDAFYANPRIQLVHHLPLCVSVVPGVRRNWGAKLDEMFLFTAHSKFYAAINAVAIAPCVMGKSNLYRRSALDIATGSQPGCGLQVFAQYIAEDNMIAECLWKNGGRTSLTVDAAIQPLGSLPLDAYVGRRIRWLRVRKYMVMAATLVEPTTESIVCGILGSFGYSVLLSSLSSTGSLFSWKFFLAHMLVWCAIDYIHFHTLLAFTNVDANVDASTNANADTNVRDYSNSYGLSDRRNSDSNGHKTETPYFAKPFYCSDFASQSGHMRSLSSWFPIWLARELLALPIWARAMAGHRIMWRNRPFRIKPDLTAEEVAI